MLKREDGFNDLKRNMGTLAIQKIHKYIVDHKLEEKDLFYKKLWVCGFGTSTHPDLIQIPPLGHRLHFVWGRGVALERAAKPEFAMMICLMGHLGTAFKTAGFLDIAHFLY